jgi:hypothetical protein
VSAVVPVPNRTLAHAKALAQAGYLVFPCAARAKNPVTEHGFYDASIELDQINAWFDNGRGLNLAIRCGLQPNGIDLLAVDVDPDRDGDTTWKELCNAHGTPLAPRHETPSGGFHLFFNHPSSRCSGDLLGRGIDTKGNGGYVVAPPSTIVDDNGEIIHYDSNKALALVYNRPIDSPLWLVEALIEPPPAPRPMTLESSISRHPSTSPLDRARLGWDWSQELLSDGWSLHSSSSGDSRWTRPGKTPREGHSATLHASGAFVVFTTDRPFGGKPTHGANGASFSPGEYVLAYRCASDWREYFRRYPDPQPPVARLSEPHRGQSDDSSIGDDPDCLVLPELDWAATPQLAHIHRAAKASWASPLAMLVHALCRTSALIPPCYKLPGLIEPTVGMATLDLMGCVVGETGEGKSYAGNVARDLVPDPEMAVEESNRSVLMDLPVGSGEGLVDAYYEEVEQPDANAKKGSRMVTKVRHSGLFLVIDEGNAFVSMNERKGVTIVETMNSAWSGETLGNTNTRTGGRRRNIQAGTVRFSAIINIQSSNAHKLFDPRLSVVGFPGRLLFAPATDSDAERIPPSWPGLLPLARWSAYDPKLAPRILTYDDAVHADIEDRRFAALTGHGSDLRRSQHLVMQCKIAGVMAMWDDRLHVTEADWTIAGTVIAASSSILDHLSSLHSRQVRDAALRAAQAAGEREYVVRTTAQRRLLAEYKAKAIAKVAKHRPTRTALYEPYRSKYRPLMKQAVEELLEEGVLTEIDGHLEPGH